MADASITLADLDRVEESCKHAILVCSETRDCAAFLIEGDDAVRKGSSQCHQVQLPPANGINRQLWCYEHNGVGEFDHYLRSIPAAVEAFDAYYTPVCSFLDAVHLYHGSSNNPEFSYTETAMQLCARYKRTVALFWQEHDPSVSLERQQLPTSKPFETEGDTFGFSSTYMDATQSIYSGKIHEAAEAFASLPALEALHEGFRHTVGREIERARWKLGITLTGPPSQAEPTSFLELWRSRGGYLTETEQEVYDIVKSHVGPRPLEAKDIALVLDKKYHYTKDHLKPVQEAVATLKRLSILQTGPGKRGSLLHSHDQ